MTNEGEGASIAAGAWIAGGRSVLVMENSGLRAACEALARLGLVNGIPVTMLMGYRGDLGSRIIGALIMGSRWNRCCEKISIRPRYVRE